MTLKDFLIEHRPEIICLFVGAVIATFFYIVVIGRKKAKWFVCEIVKMYSAKETSYFSKKRIESGVAFILAEQGSLFWLYHKYSDMATTDFCMWASIQLAIAGWMVNSIQKEKKMNLEVDKKANETTEVKI